MLDAEDLNDFVTSSKSLLEQFKNIQISDHVVFRIFPLPNPSGDNNFSALKLRCTELHRDMDARLARILDSMRGTLGSRRHLKCMLSSNLSKKRVMTLLFVMLKVHSRR